LSENKYSLMIDNSTISKTQICAIKARYIKNEGFKLDNNLSTPYLENAIVGLKFLGDNSHSKTLFEAIEEKVFDLGEEVKNNFTAITYDNAKSMKGEKNGLIALLKKEFPSRFIFGLGDPCHLLSLAVKHTMKELPEVISDFIDTMHHHFANPQRTAALYKIQKELGHKQLVLCHFVPTRWLITGKSIKRILEIWESLIKYLESKPKSSGLKKFDYLKYLNLLQDKGFKLKFTFLNTLLERINQTNITYQSQHIEIQELFRQMKNCIDELTEILLIPEKIPQDLSDLKTIPWSDEIAIQVYFRAEDVFIKLMGRELHPDLLMIESLDSSDKKPEVLKFCKNLLSKLIEMLVKYLPVESRN